ncbi:MAG: NADH:ubiquinone reductase (Na(+)-transporting) subunit F [Gammaproteobacteria bacterium]
MFGFFKNKKQDYEAEIVSAGKTLTVKPGENLLKTALEAGIDWPNDCRVGSCGTCKCRLVDGKIKPLADFSYVLEGDELREGYILACQTALKTNIKVDVDLPDSNGVEKISLWESDAVISEIKDLTHDIKEIVIRITDPKLLASNDVLYKAGECAELKLPHIDQARSYSFASAPKLGQDEFRFYIRLVPGGEFTTWLFDADRTGEALKISGPYGNFWLREESTPITCVAGGSGMSAIIGILQGAMQENIKRDVRFLFGARTQADLYCDEIISELASYWESQNLGKFEYVPCLSEEPEGTSWQGNKGFVTEFIANDLGEHIDGQAYLCGPPGMIDAAISVFEEKGLSSDAIFFDKFLDSSSMPGGR